MKKSLYYIANLQLAYNLLAQVPSITSFTPTFGPANTIVSISGTNFNSTAANNIIYFGGVQATINSSSSTLLKVSAPINAQEKPITIIDKNTGLSALSRFPFKIKFAGSPIISTSYNTPISYDAAKPNIYLATGDLDSDGKIDIVLVDFNINTIQIFRNTSVPGNIDKFSFAEKVEFGTGKNPRVVALEDIDGDGKLDIIVTNFASNNVSIFKNNSTVGTINENSFAAKIDFATGVSPMGLAVGDVDNDGKKDLLVTNLSSNSNSISILKNRATIGKIEATSFNQKFDLDLGSPPRSVTLADFNGDNKLDIAATFYNINFMTIFENKSTAGIIDDTSFPVKINFATENVPWDIVAGDLNGDEKIDIVVSNQSSNSITVYKNSIVSGTNSINGLSFAQRTNFISGVSPHDLVIADCNGDGKPEIVVTNLVSNNTSIYNNISQQGELNISSFSPKVDLNCGTGPFDVEVADFDNDGKPDIVVSHILANEIRVLKNINTSMGIKLDNYFSKYKSNILFQNYPNPFNSNTIITYQIAEETEVTIKIYNLLGNEVETLVNNELKEIGEYGVKFNANHLTSGVYLIQLKTKTQNLTSKLVLMK